MNFSENRIHYAENWINSTEKRNNYNENWINMTEKNLSYASLRVKIYTPKEVDQLNKK